MINWLIDWFNYCQGAKPGKKSGGSQDISDKQAAPDSCEFWTHVSSSSFAVYLLTGMNSVSLCTHHCQADWHEQCQSVYSSLSGWLAWTVSVCVLIIIRLTGWHEQCQSVYSSLSGWLAWTVSVCVLIIIRLTGWHEQCQSVYSSLSGWLAWTVSVCVLLIVKLIGMNSVSLCTHHRWGDWLEWTVSVVY